MSRVPRVQVAYNSSNGDANGDTDGAGGDRVVFSDLELPHRVFDGHIRAGTVADQPVTAHQTYRAARDATHGDARGLVGFSPGSLVFGAWDSTRKTRQGRYRSALVGEIIGVLADQGSLPVSRRGGARVDPVGMSVQLGATEVRGIVDGQRDELSQKLMDKIEREIGRRGKKGVSGSFLGLGGIPPSLQELGVVARSRIIRTHVLSFATLRQLRFGAGPKGDAACRALLAAFALAGLARSDAELYLRANCDLVEAGPPAVTLDTRGGDPIRLDALSIADADAVLKKALTAAKGLAKVDWTGRIFEVIGDPVIYAAASAEPAQAEAEAEV